MKNFLQRKFYFIRRIDFIYNTYKFLFLKKHYKLEKDIYNQLQQIEHYSLDRVQEFQNNKLIDFLSYCYENTKYYKKLFDTNNITLKSIADFKNIPLLTKKIVIENQYSLISSQFWKSNLSSRFTGESTGVTLQFYSNQSSGHIDNAHHWYLYSKMGYEKGDVIISGSGIKVPKKLTKKNIFWFKEPAGSVWGVYSFSGIYMKKQNIKYYVNEIIRLKPSILRGYPSFFAKIATYILQNNIRINFPVKGINLTSEMCSFYDRLIIEKAFTSMVYFEYGHMEISAYCYTTDKNYVYKSSPIYGYIEVLNEKGEDVKIGEVGSIIATGFNNLGMPFVRYDTGDLAQVCHRNGGVVHFSRIVGRKKDYIICKNHKKHYLTDLMFSENLNAFNNIVSWQLHQSDIGCFNVRIVKEPQYSNSDEEEILNSFRAISNFEIHFEYLKDIPLTKGGKHLYIIQEVKA